MLHFLFQKYLNYTFLCAIKLIINYEPHILFLISAKRPNEINNQRPTLGHTQPTRKPNQRYREGYHYQPVASTSRQSPTFVIGDDIGAGPSTSRSNDNSSA